MIIDKLWLYQFRSYDEFKVVFSPRANVIIGQNGSGKTNILEALYVLMQGRSFRDSDQELIEHDQNWWKVEASVDEVLRELRFQPNEQRSKQLYLDKASKGRFTYKQQLPVVLFEPDDLLMIHAGPSSRRDYLDDLLQRLYPELRPLYGRYERTLAQRNNLLKQRLDLTELKDAVFVWDISLSELGAQILEARRTLVKELNDKLSTMYSTLAGVEQKLTLRYETSGVTKATKGSSQLAQALAHSLSTDRQRGFTGIGPHRDDVSILLGGKNVKQTASRGEIRTLLLSLKFIELELLTETTGIQPILLLDDVFSELDSRRRKTLTKTISDYQTFITTTDADVAKRTFHKDCKFISL